MDESREDLSYDKYFNLYPKKTIPDYILELTQQTAHLSSLLRVLEIEKYLGISFSEFFHLYRKFHPSFALDFENFTSHIKMEIRRQRNTLSYQNKNHYKRLHSITKFCVCGFCRFLFQVFDLNWDKLSIKHSQKSYFSNSSTHPSTTQPRKYFERKPIEPSSSAVPPPETPPTVNRVMNNLLSSPKLFPSSKSTSISSSSSFSTPSPPSSESPIYSTPSTPASTNSTSDKTPLLKPMVVQPLLDLANIDFDFISTQSDDSLFPTTIEDLLKDNLHLRDNIYLDSNDILNNNEVDLIEF